MDAFKHTFKHEGKTYSLYKLQQTADAPWYFRIKNDRRCLETNHLEGPIGAIAKARMRLKAIQEGRYAEFMNATRLRKAIPTGASIGQILTAFEAGPLESGATYRRDAANALRNFIRRARSQTREQLPDNAVNAESCTILTDQLVRDFFATAQRQFDHCQDPLEARSIKISANSIAAQAAGVFNSRALLLYADHKLQVPCAAAFTKAIKSRRFLKATAGGYQPATDDLINRTLEAWEQVDDRNLYLAVGVALTFGLRKSEIAQTRWSWFTHIDGDPWLDGTCWDKKASMRLTIRAVDPFYTTLQSHITAKGWQPPAVTGEVAPYILAGSDTERTSEVFNRLSAWMRALGWTTTKKGHELRKWVGSQITMRYGIDQAAAWLRHSTILVTKANYNQHVTTKGTLSPESARVKWAVKPSATFVPVILPASA